MFGNKYDVAQVPGNSYDRFPDTYALQIDVEGWPVDVELIKDERISQSLNPSILRLTGYVPHELMNGDNQEVFIAFILSLKKNTHTYTAQIFF